MAWRSLGKVALLLSLLLWGCVSPVDLPTERETVPTQTQTPLELIEREVTVEVTSGDDTFRTAAYQVELSTAQIDTGSRERLQARILLRRSEPVVAPVVLDSLELLIARLPGGRRSGAEVLDGLQLDLQERLDHGTVSRSWRWRPGMPMANARIQLVLERWSSAPPQWRLQWELVMLRDARKPRLLTVRATLLLRPRR
jgi:hypothetical protein